MRERNRMLERKMSKKKAINNYQLKVVQCKMEILYHWHKIRKKKGIDKGNKIIVVQWVE
jgi:hypothetical protein